MNWTEEEIIEKNGVRWLTKEASQRFFKEYEEIFKKNGKTSVKNLREDFCINFLITLGKLDEVEKKEETVFVPPAFSEAPVSSPIFTVVDEEPKLSDEDIIILEELKKSTVISELDSMTIALFVVGLNDTKVINGKVFQKAELERIADMISRETGVECKKSDIALVVASKISVNKAKNERKKIEKDILESLPGAIANCGSDIKKITKVANIAATLKDEDGDQLYSEQAISLIIFEHLYDAGLCDDFEEIDKKFDAEGLVVQKTLTKYLNDTEYGVEALHQTFSGKYKKSEKEEKIIKASTIIDEEEAIDLDFLQQDEEEEEKFTVTSRRKATTAKDKKKVIYGLVTGAGVISMLVLTFVLKHNPISVVTECAQAFRGLFLHNSTLLELGSKMGDLVVYFGTAIATFVGANKWANRIVAEENKKDEAEEEEENFVIEEEELKTPIKKDSRDISDDDTDFSSLLESDQDDKEARIAKLTEMLADSDARKLK